MKTPAAPFFWIFGLLCASAPGLRGNDRVITRDFPVGPTCRLRLKADHGAVRISAADVASIHVEVQVSTGPLDDREFDRAFGQFDFQAKADGRTVVLSGHGPQMHFLWQEKDSLEVLYRIVVPPRCAVEVEDGSGGVNVGDLAADVTVHARRGTVYLRHIEGNIDASTTDAALVISRCGGAARLRDDRGDIRVGPVQGRLEATSVSGDIAVEVANGPATLSATAGDITLGLPRRIGGAVKAQTSNGEILLRVNPAAACSLAASSVWGDVTAVDLPLQVQAGGSGRKRLEATLQGGGPTVTLHADGGHVVIKPSHL